MLIIKKITKLKMAKQKEIMVQIGSTIYKLTKFKELTCLDELKEVLETYEIRLLKEK